MINICISETGLRLKGKVVSKDERTQRVATAHTVSCSRTRMGGTNTVSDLDGSRQFPVDVFKTVLHKLQCVPDLLAAWFNRGAACCP